MLLIAPPNTSPSLPCPAEAVNASGRPMFLESVAGFYFLRDEVAQYTNRGGSARTTTTT